MVATARKPKSKIIPLTHKNGLSEKARVEWWREGNKCKVNIFLDQRESLGVAERFADAFDDAKRPLVMEGFNFDLQKMLNLIHDWNRKSTRLPLLHPDGSRSLAEVKWWQRAWKNTWCCYVSIKGTGFSSRGKRGDFFDALEEARLPFEERGYRLLCYGASLNVFPSSMGRSCSLGEESYQYVNGNPEKIQKIFETGTDVVPATVREQRTFNLQWRNKDQAERVEYNDQEFRWPIDPIS